MPRSEAGFTLSELLIAMALSLLLISAGGAVMVNSIHSEPRASSRASAVERARTAMDQMTRELRQGSSVTTATATQVVFVTQVDQATCGGALAATAILCRVTYSCSSGACTRTVAQPNGSSPGPAQTVVSGLSSSSVFSYGTTGGSCTQSSATSPTSVCLLLAFPGQGGGNAITLSDGVAMRNI